MPQPTKSSIHVDRPLTNVSVAYMNTGNFVAPQVFPRVPVSFQSDQFYKYVKADWLRSQAEIRGPATESAGSGWNLTTDTYAAVVRAIHKDIADQQRANADAGINLDTDATRWVTRQIQMRMEQDWVSEFFTAGQWSSELDGSTADFTQWGDSSGDPIGDVTGQGVAIEETTGYKPNTVVTNPNVSLELRNHADMLDRIKYTQTGIVTADLIAAVFDVDRYLVASAITDTSTEGAATDSPGFISGDHLLLAYAAPSPSLMEPSAGYTFVWTGLVGSVEGMQVKRFRMDELEADRVEGQSAYDQKIVASDTATIFVNAIA